MPDDTMSETPHETLRGTDPLGDEIAELSAHLDAAQYRLLTLIHRYDREELWDGWRSCAHWLSWRTGITLGPARERVRVARCLAALPRTSEEMRRGQLSWSRVRALTRIATAEDESRWLEFARHATASQLERLVRARRSAEAAAAAAEGEESELSTRRFLTVRAGEDGMYELRGRLLPEVGALLVQALDAAGDELHRAQQAAAREARAPAGPPSTQGERRHDALEAWLEDRTEADVQVVVHTVAGKAGSGGGAGSGGSAGNGDVVSTEDGSHVPAGTSRRLTCDAETVRVTRGLDGSILDVGRRRRTVNWRLRKALDVRDGGCRFPGCGSRYVQAHHAIPWAEGGRTSLDNLILLCRFHHRTVHEGGWRVKMGSAGAARFHSPDGRVVAAVPPRRPDVKAPRTADSGLGPWHRQEGINPWTATNMWHGDRLDLDWALWAMWGQYEHLGEAA